MASKKSKRLAVARAPRAPKVTEKTLGESIIEQMQALNVTVGIIATHLADRNSMLSAMTTAPAEAQEPQLSVASACAKAGDVLRAAGLVPEDVLYKRAKVCEPSAAPTHGLVTTDPAAAVAHVGAVSEAPVPKKRGRKSNAEKAALALALAAAQVEIVPVEAATPAVAPPPPPKVVHTVFPEQCPCGVREDVPKHLHAKGCPVHFPAEPVPEHRAAPSEPPPPPPAAQATEAAPAPTLDDVRATAIAFVGTHGKEKLTEMLKKYGADKLSSVAVEKLPALLADLQAVR